MRSAADPIDIGALKLRYPEAFVADLRARFLTIGIVGLMCALYVGAFAYFDVPWARLTPGLWQLVWFLREMVPPDPSGHFCERLFLPGDGLPRPPRIQPLRPEMSFR